MLRPGMAKGPSLSPNVAGSAPASLTAVPTWVKVATLGFADFSFAGLDNNITLFSLISRGCISGLGIEIVTAFSGPAIASYQVSIGIAGTLDFYTALYDVTQAPGATIFQLTPEMDIQSIGGATSIMIRSLTTGANLSVANAGSIKIFALLSKWLT